jgi:hypothetical protein
MKVRFLLVLIVLLLFILVLPLQTSIQAGEDEPDLNNVTFWFVVGRSKSQNRSYQLTSINWQASGISAGNDYTLTSPQGPSESSGGCCCTYLPCVFKDW